MVVAGRDTAVALGSVWQRKISSLSNNFKGQIFQISSRSNAFEEDQNKKLFQIRRLFLFPEQKRCGCEEFSVIMACWVYPISFVFILNHFTIFFRPLNCLKRPTHFYIASPFKSISSSQSRHFFMTRFLLLQKLSEKTQKNKSQWRM